MQGGKIKLNKSSADVFIKSILNYCLDNKVRDIHFEPAEKHYVIRIRLGKFLSILDKIPIALAENAIVELKDLANIGSPASSPQEGYFKYKNLNIQLSTLPVLGGEKLFLHLTDQTILSSNLTKLGLWGQNLQVVQSTVKSTTSGIILVLGEGKNTTMFNLLSLLNTEKLNLCTIENRPSYTFKNVNQFIAEKDYTTLAPKALKALVKQRANVILLSQIDTPKLAEAVFDTASEGKLIISSLPVSDSFSAAEFLSNLGIPPFLIAHTVKLIISQDLVPAVDSKKLIPYPVSVQKSASILANNQISAGDLHNLELSAKAIGLGSSAPLSTTDTTITTLYKTDSKPTPKIEGIFEVLQMSDLLKKLILSNFTSVDIKETLLETGFVTKKQDYLLKSLRKVVPFNDTEGL